MAENVNIRNHRPLLHLSKVDFRCIVEVFQRHLGRDIDLFGLLLVMNRNKLVSKKVFVYIRQCILESRIQIREFVPQILVYLSFEQFCFVFDQEGYTDITYELRKNRFSCLYKKPGQAEMPHSRRTHAYYKTLKSCIDNGAFICDRKLQLRKFIKDQDEKIISKSEVSLSDRQLAMEKKAAATVLLIQQHKEKEVRKAILEQSVATETNGVDNTSLQIIYHSKMAVTEAQAGNVNKAEEHIVQTKSLCLMYRPCFAVTSAFHDIHYTYKLMFFMKPSKEMLERVLIEGDIAIQSLNEEETDVQNLWRRIMLLLMVLSLLFITPEFVVCDISKISTVHKNRAEKILKEIIRCSDHIELRRQMILYICLAVLYEENDIATAETYAKQSLTAARNGGCYRDIEQANIELYLKKLQAKKIKNKLFKLLIMFVFRLGLLGLFVYW